jgi:hypothetical protein
MSDAEQPIPARLNERMSERILNSFTICHSIRRPTQSGSHNNEDDDNLEPTHIFCRFALDGLRATRRTHSRPSGIPSQRARASC